jgi:hypothetical protein
MKNQYKIINDKSELFLAPIPKWITHYGFILMLFIGLLLLFFSFVIKYPETKNVTVLLTKRNAFVIMDFDTYKYITPHQNMKITVPIIGQLNATIEPDATQLTHNSVINNLSIKTDRYSGIIKDTVYCKGEITLNNFSLMERLINK